MNERMEVYNSIRSEIISMEELQRSVWVNMYVLFATLFVLGIEWSHYLFLVSYIILIPFQCVINNYKWSIIRMSTYIKVFFEDENKDMGWESFHMSENYVAYDRRIKKSLTQFLGRTGAVQLGLLATGFFCYRILILSYSSSGFVFSLIDLVLLVISIILFIITVIINKEYYKDYNTELEKILNDYKKERRNV